MKTTKNLVFTCLLIATSFVTNAQTADEIIDNYFKNIGGKEKFEKLNAFKMDLTTSVQGMDIPVEVYQDKEGKQYIKYIFQGKEITQLAFDGKKGWSTNSMTMKAEEINSEIKENLLNDLGNFPDPFLNYKQKGYKVEMLGKETKEGTECFKIKLTKKPNKVDGKMVDNVSFYYFETDNYIPIMTEAEIQQGPMKGQMSTSTMGDYQEVQGMYFPFTMNQGGQAMTVKKIEINPTVDDKVFEMKTE